MPAPRPRQVEIGAHSHQPATARKIFPEYIDLIPDETFVDSCIFHGRQRCVVIRQRRSVKCNEYMCTSLQQLRDVVREGSSDLVLAATNLREQGAFQVYRIRLVTAR